MFKKTILAALSSIMFAGPALGAGRILEAAGDTKS